ncbi:MAG: hypothetical protein IT198_15680 [Acidimicrobiia bacterium]|nr:hypothetical protein [Acidimicrobiia bacterium]
MSEADVKNADVSDEDEEIEEATPVTSEGDVGDADVGGTNARKGLARPLKLAIGAAVVVGVIILLWFVVFPWVEGLLPAEF